MSLDIKHWQLNNNLFSRTVLGLAGSVDFGWLLLYALGPAGTLKL